MTRKDDQVEDAVPSQKLEWVAPKISLMMVEATFGSGKINAAGEEGLVPAISAIGPS
jgi:hypothetical protein